MKKRKGKIVSTPCKGHDRPRQQAEWVTSSAWDRGKLDEARRSQTPHANNADRSYSLDNRNVSSLNGLGEECRDITGT